MLCLHSQSCTATEDFIRPTVAGDVVICCSQRLMRLNVAVFIFYFFLNISVLFASLFAAGYFTFAFANAMSCDAAMQRHARAIAGRHDNNEAAMGPKRPDSSLYVLLRFLYEP